jgi:DNA-binding transcriptional ArsR family regulator
MDELPYLEERIARKILKIDSRIKELSMEKSALERLLIDARRDNAAKTEAVRSNSGKRILVENSILKALRRSPAPVSNKDLYLHARTAVFDLKESTFRSHIKRMKDAGKIAPSGKRWILPKNKSE